MSGRALVTGCAGFLGSSLCERLVDRGREVLGVDCFSPYYVRAVKERNLERLRQEPRFRLAEVDLATDPLDELLEGAHEVFHLAARAGVRGSFGESFQDYVRDNVVATQRLLEAAASARPDVFVYASSSSVYGDAPRHPTTEATALRPVSPYGMTKVATEHLAGVYRRCFDVRTVGLRYFTAYGPRQRPDMAFTRFFGCALAGRPVPINGDGHQIRDFTFVDDVVEGTIAAAAAGRPGTVYNIGGGAPVHLLEAVHLIAELTGRRVEIAFRAAPVGEARRTGCDGALARRDLGFAARTSLAEGLAAQLEWVLGERRAEAVAA